MPYQIDGEVKDVDDHTTITITITIDSNHRALAVLG
jgi:hypothetical protein